MRQEFFLDIIRNPVFDTELCNIRRKTIPVYCLAVRVPVQPADSVIINKLTSFVQDTKNLIDIQDRLKTYPCWYTGFVKLSQRSTSIGVFGCSRLPLLPVLVRRVGECGTKFVAWSK